MTILKKIESIDQSCFDLKNKILEFLENPEDMVAAVCGILYKDGSIRQVGWGDLTHTLGLSTIISIEQHRINWEE